MTLQPMPDICVASLLMAFADSDIKQKDLAELWGMDSSSISHMRRCAGPKKFITYATVRKIYNTALELLGEEEVALCVVQS